MPKKNQLPRQLTCPEASDHLVPHLYKVLSEEDDKAVVMHIRAGCRVCYSKLTTIEIAIDVTAEERGEQFSPPMPLPPQCLATVRTALQYLEHRLSSDDRVRLDEHVASGCVHCPNLMNALEMGFRSEAELARRRPKIEAELRRRHKKQ
jgi:hypothetical protein